MVALEGKFYQVRSDGSVLRVPGKATTPFAAVTFFHRDLRLRITQPISVADLGALIDQQLPSPNLFYAVKLEARFVDLTTRSVPKQVTPYPPLAVVIANQTTFPLHNIDGTMVGFRSPNFVKGINQAGYHFHFVSDDEKYGGHVLSGRVLSGTIEIQILQRHEIYLPDTPGFLGASLPLQ
jgi:acetolactate decarboxylase